MGESRDNDDECMLLIVLLIDFVLQYCNISANIELDLLMILLLFLIFDS